jgi:hypothetical protein
MTSSASWWIVHKVAYSGLNADSSLHAEAGCFLKKGRTERR